MPFKEFFISAFFIVIVLMGAVGSALHYKKQSETTALLLKQSEAANQQHLAMLARYEKQNAELVTQLNQANKQAEQRRLQLKEVLNRDENQIWTYGRVPRDVAGLLNDRTAKPQHAANLPTNH